MLLVLVPTKESVAHRVLGDRAPGLAPLAEAEESVRRALADAARANGDTVLDLLPVLAEAAAAAVGIYPRDADGHPAAGGHAVIADAVAESLLDLPAGE